MPLIIRTLVALEVETDLVPSIDMEAKNSYSGCK